MPMLLTVPMTRALLAMLFIAFVATVGSPSVAVAKPMNELNPTDAHTLAMNMNPWLFSTSELPVNSGGRTVRAYLSPRAALVERDGRESVAVASAPVAAADADGKLRAVDLAIERRGADFSLKRPAVGLKLPGRADGLIGFGSGDLTIEPLVGAGSAEALISTGALFYADAGGKGVDLIVKPIPGGMETFYQLREATRRRIALRVGGRGINLARRADGGVDIIRDEATVATVAPPAAHDAEGTRVPVAYSTAGNSIVLDVDTSGFALPVLVDPTITEEYLYWDQGTSVDFGGWQFFTSTAYLTGTTGTTYPSPYPGWGRGMYLYTTEAYRTTQSAQFTAGQWGEYRFDPQGAGYVESLFYNGLSNYYNQNGYPLAGQAEACSQIGMYSPALGRFEDKQVWTSDHGSGVMRTHEYCTHRNHQAESHTGTPGTSTAGTPGNYAVFKADIRQSGRTGPFSLYFSGGVLYLGDADYPTFASTSHANIGYDTWSPGQSDTITIKASDAGLGMKYLDLWNGGGTDPVPSYSSDGQGISTCAGKRYAMCPPSVTTAITYNTASLPEGVHTLHAKAEDVLGKKTDHAWTVRVDRTAPTFASDFSVGTNYVATSQRAVVDWDPATDPAPASGGTPSEINVYRSRYRVNNGSWTSWADTSGLTADVGTTQPGSTVGFEVQAIDNAGNIGPVASRTTTVAADCARPTADGYLGTCQPDDLAQTEDIPDPGADFEPDPSRAFPSRRYVIRVANNGWTTIRNKHNSLVIGNARDGWSFDQYRGAYDDALYLGWRHGEVLGAFHACGWVRRKNLPDDGDTGYTTTCDRDLVVPPRQLSDGYNCLACNGGTLRKLIRPTPMWANVSPNPAAGRPLTGLGDPVRTITQADIDRGYYVRWRYVTKKSPLFPNYVMVRDYGYSPSDARPHGPGVWVFIKRSALPSRLCTRTSPDGCGGSTTGG
jgi:hypothetical protein